MLGFRVVRRSVLGYFGRFAWCAVRTASAGARGSGGKHACRWCVHCWSTLDHSAAFSIMTLTVCLSGSRTRDCLRNAICIEVIGVFTALLPALCRGSTGSSR